MFFNVLLGFHKVMLTTVTTHALLASGYVSLLIEVRPLIGLWYDSTQFILGDVC